MPRPKKIAPTPGLTSAADTSFHKLQALITEHIGPPPLGLVIALAHYCQNAAAAHDCNTNGTDGNHTLFSAQGGNGDA